VIDKQEEREIKVGGHIHIEIFEHERTQNKKREEFEKSKHCFKSKKNVCLGFPFLP
jgi:hypothetical protein